MMSGSSLMVSTAALVGFTLAEDKALATLPLAAQHLAVTLMSIPASLVMEKIGRRAGFMSATVFGLGGAALATWSVINGSFWLFVVAAMLIGCFNGFGNYYRFAAADSVESSQKARAISWVMAGGVVAAIIGPNLANLTQESLASTPFAGSFASMSVLYVMSLLAMWAVSPPSTSVIENEIQQTSDTEESAARPISQVILQPRYIVAIISAMLGYGVMSLVMTSTPLAMNHHDHQFADTAFVIQWHVLGMFVPSFFTGRIIASWGLLRVMTIGALAGLACVSINLAGTTLWHFWLALVLLGVSWNFLFIGGTTMLTETYRPAERAKAQGINDFSVFAIVALASLSAGFLHHNFGWQIVNLGVIPLLLIVLASLLFLKIKEQKNQSNNSVK